MSEKNAYREPADMEERRYIVENTGECLVVEAGAGTGKTTLLIDRIMSLLLAEGARLRDIAAITFTEKAAGELKVRLYEKLDEMLDAGAPGQEDRLRQALADIEVCQVSTIHSFAANLLKTRPVEAGVDPGFEVADENDMRFITAEVWRGWLQEKLTEGDTLLDLASALGASVEKLKALAGMLYENRDLLDAGEAGYPDMVEIGGLLKRGEESIRATVHSLEVILDRLKVLEDEPSMDQIASLIGSWQKYVRAPGKPELAALLLATSKAKVRKTKTAGWPGTGEDFNEQKGLRLKLQQQADEIITRIGNLLAPGILLEVLDYTGRAEAEKRGRGLLDFQDLLLKARNMLRDNLEVRTYFQGRFSHILVDEFQDTDPLQAEIVFFLAEDVSKAADWDAAILKPGKLFIVGDPKQSIYRFRRADVETYDRAKAAIGGKGATRYITQNFRSVEGIIDRVNDIFGLAMRPVSDEAYQAEYRDIECFVGPGEGQAVRLVHNRGSEKVLAETSRELEAVFLAESIREMVSGGYRVRGKDGRGRPVTFRDICVLFRITTNVHIYERVFREHDIPFRTEGGRNFFTRQEVLDLRNAVCAIDNLYDEVSLVGALRSPFFGVSDSELADFALGGGRFDYLCPPTSILPRQGGGSSHSVIAEAFRILAGLHREKDLRPVTTTLELLLDETMAREIYTVAGRGEQTLANFAKVVDEARSLEAREGLTFSGFAEWLSRMEQENVVAGESPVEEVGDNFVHIMSIHKAKGLEFPVVFMAGIGKGPNPKDVRVIPRHRTGAIGFRIGRITTEGFDELAEWNRESELSEECRVFYVSATRARDLLVIDDFQAKTTSSWFKGILDSTGARQLCGPFEEEIDLSSLSVGEMRGEPGLAGAAPAAVDIEDKERGWSEGLEDAMRIGEGGYVTQTATGAEGTPPYPEKEFWPGLVMGKPVGEALHRIMEIAGPADRGGDTPALIRSLAAQNGVADREEQLAQMVDNILESGIWQRAVSSGNFTREMPFYAKTDEGYMTGSVDLVFIENGEAVVVDYKSDNVAAEEVDGRLDFYRPQGEFYARALERVLGKPVKEVVFLFAAPGISRQMMGSDPEI